MKIFITTFYHDLIAEVDGYIIEGELTDLVQTREHKRVLH
jgi:hypothetical protein